MLVWILRIVSYIFLFYLLYFGQELGRYFIGLWLDIPGDKIKIKLSEFPQRTAIFDGEKWIASEEEDFLKAYSRYDPLWQNGFLYACSGLFTESLFAIILTIISLLVGWQEVALATVIVTFVLNFMQMFYSIYISWKTEAIKGDYTVIYVLDSRRAFSYVIMHYLLRVVLLSLILI